MEEMKHQICAPTRYTGNGHENAGANRSQIVYAALCGAGILYETQYLIQSPPGAVICIKRERTQAH
jgi:hypothetical protein